MIQLDESKYEILLSPLKRVGFNTFFARSVIAGHAEGKVFVDSVNNPKSFYAVHSYGKMSLLFGDAGNERFNNELTAYFGQKNRRDEWLQAHPRAWDAWLDGLANAKKAVRYSRLNFAFDREEYKKNNHEINLNDYSIIPTTADMFNSIDGSVVPKAFWRDERLFSQYCAGFTAMVNGKPAATAFTSYLHDGCLEIGIETAEGHRGKGLARAVCMALINYSLANNLEPVWSCRLENAASVNLAKKLGFRESLRLPYYHVPAQI
ncbi:MAG: GNAT family N-acetyltransferase [Defluviitaleaceae bacterium]|nr:GNAT family N-acetyltransferase [Defluviitaleaceae bacterium]MCL2835625.1 GNAT family N-acetyltransferase [Defluviitaleaceae bacterium]